MTDFLAAHSGIRQLYARCIDAVWRKQSDAFAECFSETGEWKIVGLHMTGREEIRQGFEKLTSTNARVMMIFGEPLLAIKGNTATGKSHVTELVKRKNGQGMRTLGTYYENFVQQGNLWLFQCHQFDLHYSGPVDLTSPLNECEDFGLPADLSP